MILSAMLTILTLAGFAYGSQEAPSGNEWQSPQELSLNKEQPHAWFFSFTSRSNAVKILPENSSLWQSLDGVWKFNWVANPEERPADFYRTDYDDSGWNDLAVPSSWNVAGLGKDGSQKYGTPIYVNANVPFYHEIVPDDWRLGVMRTPPENYTMFKARNEVGSYRRSFTLPKDWNGKDVFIDFDGVDSFFYLWVNGKYVGFSKNSRNTASFNITEYIKDGENILAVEVYRNSDASNLEAQDMFRLPGIFRTVALEAKPKTHVRDIRINPSLNFLNVNVEVVGEASALDYYLYEYGLYSDDAKLVAQFKDQQPDACLCYEAAKPWSAEAPYRYALVGELKDAAGEVQDIFSTVTGFRTVEIKDTPASEDEFGNEGRYFYINGKTVKLRGVNRHETHPAKGHAVTREMMEEDVMLMKRANVNHVRDSHYPDDPYWYWLCDKYGIYLMDEANIESHHYRYGEASLSHPAEWLNAHLARMTEMMAQNYNHPSIVIWSMGNEAGPGINFKYTYDMAKAFDPIRPVQYERNNGYSDIGCRQYPSVAWVADVATGKADVKYPYHINEFAHSMGNSLGDFADYWKEMDSSNYFIGGCVWDWVDQGIYNWTPDGTRYIGYGGDFGDVPNDGQFVMNGVILADRTPKPQYYELKKVYQNIYISGVSPRRIRFTNRNYFEPVDYRIEWTVLADGKVAKRGSFDTGLIAPRGSKIFDLGIKNLPEGKECFINFSAKTKKNLPWAKKGYEAASEQIFLSPGVCEAQENKASAPLIMSSSSKALVVEGKNLRLEFDSKSGVLQSYKYHGRDIVVPGYGPQLNVFRALVNNDSYWFQDWFNQGLHNLKQSLVVLTHKTFDDGSLRLTYKLEISAPNSAELNGSYSTPYANVVENPDDTDVMKFTVIQSWTISPAGSVEVRSKISSDDKEMVLARLGYVMKIPAKYGKLNYYGRGPLENYPDRYTSQFVGLYKSTPEDQFFNYHRPQECGNHEGVRWASLTGRFGKGVRFTPIMNNLNSDESGRPVMSMTAIKYSALDMVNAMHPHQLPDNEDTWLCLDAKVLGLGGASCGPNPQEHNRVYSEGEFGFAIHPLK